MSKNIVIFSDGTGNSSGYYLDENRSNIYKLYRATRCGPDSSVDPAEQLVFYDPGVGTSPPDAGAFRQWYDWVVVLVGKATGLGLTTNVVECYAALIRLWEPGDKIFLFGFSRGAYTVRLLGGVISLCGVPTAPRDQTSFRRDPTQSLKLAREAVVKIYQHASSKSGKKTDREQKWLDQRALLAKKFRDEHCGGGEPNVAPRFIGVFDTVSSLHNRALAWVLTLIGLLALLVLSFTAAWLTDRSLRLSMWDWLTTRLLKGDLLPSLSQSDMAWAAGWFMVMAGLTVLWLMYRLIRSSLKFPGSLVDTTSGDETVIPWWKTTRVTWGPMKFNDFTLGEQVKFARHALSIDERRKSFELVQWQGYTPRQLGPDTREPWVRQVWFAGVHSDIGGGYAENRARLSDIALEWMVVEAKKADLKVDPSFLQLSPDAAGPQHDETKSSVFRYFSKEDRDIKPTDELHPSVLDRKNAGPVLHYDVMKRYNPDALRGHEIFDPKPREKSAKENQRAEE